MLDGERIAFRLVRARRRSIGFVVDERGLTVRAPSRVSLREIDDAVREKRRWIVARLAEQRARSQRLAATRVVWRDGATVDYLGRPLTIAIDPAATGSAGEGVLVAAGAFGAAGLDATAREANGSVAAPRCDAPLRDEDGSGTATAAPTRLVIALPRDADEARIRDAVHGWLQREARRVFAERVAHFATRLGVRVTRLSLSSAATRWGSANANGAVRLHWRLIQHAPATIDYVVAHELAHLREMNHSPRFWSVVRSVVPDYEAARRQLREAGRSEAERGRAQAAWKRITPSLPSERSSLPRNQSACRWASDSPIANVIWCRSSARLNSTGTRSNALCGALAHASMASSKRSAWCACSWSMRVCRPLNGRPCEGSTSTPGSIRRMRSIDSR